MNNFYAEYRDVTAFQFTENDKTECSLYDVFQPFESWVATVEDGVDFVTTGGTPYTPEQNYSIDYLSMEMTSMFKDKLKDWDHPGQIKKWPTFKRMFSKAHKTLRRAQQSIIQHGFANNV